jgi:ATP-dependent DNA helicase RecG
MPKPPSTEVQYLPKVGPPAAPKLAKLGLRTGWDLLRYLPRRYEDRRNMPPIGRVQIGQWVTICGDLKAVEARPTRRGMVMLKAIVGDRTGRIALTWFNQPWIARTLEKHEGRILAYGLVKEVNGSICEIAAPEYELISDEDDPEDFLRIVPIYRLTEGVPQKLVRRAVRSAIENCLEEVIDPIPEDLRLREGVRDLRWSLARIHDPESEEERLEARRRLVFEEFFYLQVGMAMKRAELGEEMGIAFPIGQLLEDVGDVPINSLFSADPSQPQTGGLWSQIQQMLPFDLTRAQHRVIEEIWSDMARPHPMNRLVQGDVGSGKTAVAACAILAAVRSGSQAAIMAPTEILAEQHYANFKRLFEPLGIEVELLVGKLTPTQKRKAQERTAEGYAQIAVGTHALVQEGVKFKRLGFAVIDEQHRFGVLQRKALRDKGLGNPDVLVMTATPIPRTLTIVTYGDLEISVIDELPPGRKPIKTHWKMISERESVYAAVRKMIDQGRQAYFVCPLVSETEKMNAQAAEDLHYRLTQVYPDLKVGLLHGQLKSKEKEEVMEQFRSGVTQILVSTTVIEVGVDVPNATVMVIEDANRFGLAQLHQLRGRVGRGDHQSFCVLVAEATSEDARQRMEVMVSTNDGFVIAEEDLRLRGPGVIAGTQQSGNADFAVGDLVLDGKMMEVARQAAFRLIAEDPRLENPNYAGILEQVKTKRSDLAIVTVS